MITSAIPKLPFINKQATLDFYIGQLGFELSSDYGDYLILYKDGVELHFFSFPTLVPAKSDFMIYLRVDAAIDSMYEGYMNNELPFAQLGKLETKPWGQKEFSIIDPSGTLLTFGQGG